MHSTNRIHPRTPSALPQDSFEALLASLMPEGSEMPPLDSDGMSTSPTNIINKNTSVFVIIGEVLRSSRAINESNGSMVMMTLAIAAGQQNEDREACINGLQQQLNNVKRLQTISGYAANQYSHDDVGTLENVPAISEDAKTSEDISSVLTPQRQLVFAGVQIQDAIINELLLLRLCYAQLQLELPVELANFDGCNIPEVMTEYSKQLTTMASDNTDASISVIDLVKKMFPDTVSAAV